LKWFSPLISRSIPISSSRSGIDFVFILNIIQPDERKSTGKLYPPPHGILYFTNH
jgi:hypothetical protein